MLTSAKNITKKIIIFNIKQNTLNKLCLKNHEMQCRYEGFDFTGDRGVHCYFLKLGVCLWSPECLTLSHLHIITSSSSHTDEADDSGSHML